MMHSSENVILQIYFYTKNITLKTTGLLAETCRWR